MRRRPAIIATTVLLSLALLASVFAWLVTHEPAFYRDALGSAAAPEARRSEAKRFVQRALALADDASNAQRWSAEFTAEQVNAWLAEDLPRQYSEWLPPGVTEPRVKFEPGAARIAFRARQGRLRGVVSGRVRVWTTAPNELALAFDSFCLGLVPLPLDQFAEGLSRQLAAMGHHTQWKRTPKEDVLLVRFSDSQPGLASQPALDAIEIDAQGLRLSGGRREDSNQLRGADTGDADETEARTR